MSIASVPAASRVLAGPDPSSTERLRGRLRSMTRFEFDRSWDFDVPVAELWDAIESTDRYPQWWDWLEDFDSAGMVPGARTSCTVRSPLLYSVSFVIDLQDVIPGELVVAQVSGDLAGSARLYVRARPGGSAARITWSLVPVSRVLVVAALPLKPLMKWGHNRVVDSGVAQFRRAALQGDED